MYGQNNGPPWWGGTFRAMGCEIHCWLDIDDEFEARQAFSKAEELFLSSENALSRFLPSSELSLLNSRPEEWVPVSPLLWEMVTAALGMAQETGGLFDPTMAAGIKAAGYDRSFELLAWDVELSSRNPSGGFLPGRRQEVGLDNQNQEVLLPRGVGLDLGGIAKGLTAQKVVSLLSLWGPCLVDAGGDLAAGEAPPGWPGWPVAMAAAGGGEEQDLATLWLAEASLSTSGVDWRRWSVNGRLAHHALDPLTGSPAETDLLSVTVLDADAGRAEAWATAVLVAGLAQGAWLLAREELPALVQQADGQPLVTAAMAQKITNAQQLSAWPNFAWRAKEITKR